MPMTCDKLCEEKYNRMISLFYDISLRLSPGSDINDSLYFVIKSLKEKLGTSGCTVTILNRKTGEIIISLSEGMSETEKAKGKYRIGEGITGLVVENGEAIVIPDISKDSRFLNKTGYVRDKQQTAFICVPVKSTKQVIGTLAVYKKQFEKEDRLEDDLRILSILAMMISRAVSLHRALYEERAQLLRENQRLQAQLREQYHPQNIIGSSGVMRAMFGLIGKVAKSNSTVLILGESGVGKELAAQAIHFSGSRAEKPLIAFNCAALPENLLESELFGHLKGSFTGAIANKTGKFEAAEGGSIFLDEIGELSLSAQVRLLRVLQEKEFEKIGSIDTIKLDVRVMAATNKDLFKLVEQGKFREDLYYRLNVFPITVPPLRERKTDIPLLADHFIEKYSRQNSKEITRISTPAIDMLMSYHWPGNVRELENCIERAVILADEGVIHGFHLPPSLQKINKISEDEESGILQKQLDVLEYELIIEELKRSEGNMKKTAGRLGLTYRQFRLRIEKYKIQVDQFKAN